MSKELLYGVLIGGAAGALAGLLLAPKSGEELREDISDLYEDINKQASKKIGGWTDLSKEYASNSADKVASFIEWAEAGIGLWNKLKR